MILMDITVRISIILSYIVGILAGLVLGELNKLPVDLSSISSYYILAIMATGYTGTDAIEAVFNKYLQKIKPETAPAPNE
jgi:hypothetical protein